MARSREGGDPQVEALIAGTTITYRADGGRPKKATRLEGEHWSVLAAAHGAPKRRCTQASS